MMRINEMRLITYCESMGEIRLHLSRLVIVHEMRWDYMRQN